MNKNLSDAAIAAKALAILGKRLVFEAESQPETIIVNWRMRIKFAIIDLRIRLGEWIAGRRFDDE
jgi:hypothetical protein